MEDPARAHEWSVKVHAHPPSSRKATPAEPAVMGGAAYLRSNEAAGAELRAAEERALSAARDVDQALRELAVATRHRWPQESRLSGTGGAILLDAAYLVDARSARAFAERVAELAVEHPEVSVACGGPRPPHSFTMPEGQ